MVDWISSKQVRRIFWTTFFCPLTLSVRGVCNKYEVWFRLFLDFGGTLMTIHGSRWLDQFSRAMAF